MMKPDVVLCDFGGTLVLEKAHDLYAGNQWLLSQASVIPKGVTLDAVVARARQIGQQVADRRYEIHVETPWSALFRLVYDHLGVKFEEPVSDLELGFWRASILTRPLPGVPETLHRLAGLGIRMGVVSNTSFGAATLRAELEKHGLADCFEVILTSADYSIRKPNPLLFEMAATLLGVQASAIWFVGDRQDADVVGANAAGMTSVLLGVPTPDSDKTVKPAIAVADWWSWPQF